MNDSPAATVVHADSLVHLRTLADDSVDAIVTDPPYGLSATSPQQVAEAITRWATGDRAYLPEGKGFMAASWDSFVPPPALWDECFRVLRPGGHLAAFAGSRTLDLMTLSVRLAGFDVRDCLMWIYGSGMPKGQDVGKTVEAQVTQGASNSRTLREVEQPGDGRAYVGYQRINGTMSERSHVTRRKTFAPTTDEGQQWSGWSTALKPAHEPILLARKPLAESSVARNVLAHGTGALNTGANRIPHRNEADLAESTAKNRHADFGTPPGRNQVYGDYSSVASKNYDGSRGRHPANVLLSHGDDCTEEACTPGCPVDDLDHRRPGPAGVGGPSRFFYTGKASARERPSYIAADGRKVQHVSVKPLDLMRWLVRLLTAEGGLVLDPFAGSGTTAEAALLEGFDVLAIEREADYLPLIQERIERATTPAAAA